MRNRERKKRLREKKGRRKRPPYGAAYRWSDVLVKVGKKQMKRKEDMNVIAVLFMEYITG